MSLVKKETLLDQRCNSKCDSISPTSRSFQTTWEHLWVVFMITHTRENMEDSITQLLLTISREVQPVRCLDARLRCDGLWLGLQMGIYSHESNLLYCWFRERHMPQAGVHYCAITFLLLFIQKSQIPENSRGEEFCFILATSQLIPFSEELHSTKQTGNVWLLSNPLGSSSSSESKLYISARAWQPAALTEW